jgi:hypothetical protein
MLETFFRSTKNQILYGRKFAFKNLILSENINHVFLKEDGLTFATLSGVKLEYPGADFAKDQASDENHMVVARKSSAPIQQVFTVKVDETLQTFKNLTTSDLFRNLLKL